jgi:Flp pilus assembly protein TadG
MNIKIQSSVQRRFLTSLNQQTAGTTEKRHRDPAAKFLCREKSRRGTAAILSIFLIIVMVVMLGTIVDLSYVHVSQAELRRSSDAAALAGGWALFDAKVLGTSDSATKDEVAESTDLFSSRNVVAKEAPRVAFDGDDVEVGYYDVSTGQFNSSSIDELNAVRVKIHRQDSINGEVPLFFGGVLGRYSQPMTSTSTAALINNLNGFHIPPSEVETLDLLPFALDVDTWEQVVAKQTSDTFRVQNGCVVSGSNGLFECNLYPQGTGSPGNRGTVDIGPGNNSTNDIARQIISGISREDLLQLATPLEFDNQGELFLTGDTGISAGVKDELDSIVGQKRVIPIFREVNGNGNNAVYTIVKFAGVRILEVKLTGRMSGKRVIVEPAPIVARYVKIATEPVSRSDYVYSPVVLVN